MIKKEELAKLATLSRIVLTQEEESAFQDDIEAILGYVKDIEDARLKEVLPSAGAVRNIFRSDDEFHESGIYTEELLDAAPKREGDYIKVKRILTQ